MAFCNKFGSILKQSLSAKVQGSMLNSIRGVASTTKLFIGGLSFGTDDHSLRDAFSSFGEVVEARVILDRDTGRSRGFGFVNYSSDESASSALQAMDGQELQGRNIRVSYANEREPRTGGFNSGGFGGSFGGRAVGDDSF
ncbi:hypothetical protein SAY86_017611 [Trapa natans]|uniref:RRM domain-containing protein n=1 Tax=Trapa natans TaxID=22666 RepID=A0AAN7R582_TRANT|nr:hypothetical protein SAY86_017611 [Trapa natans]